MIEGMPERFDHPIEIDCECGSHNVLDPDALNQFMKQRRFRCHECGRSRIPIKRLRGMTWDDSGHLVGICEPCEAKFGD